MQTILINHAQRYPLWTMDDLYKLVHQAAMGSEHAVSDADHARHWLTQELSLLAPGPAEPLLDPISPDRRFVRVHLRPFAAQDLDPEVLWMAFHRTARCFPGSTARLADYAHAAYELAQTSAIPFPPGQLAEYMRAREAAGFPAIHHSRQFAEAYLPAYRVVAREYLPRAIQAMTWIAL